MYRSLMGLTSGGEQQQQQKSKTSTALDYTAERMANAAADKAIVAGDDERLLRYQQEFKRYSKLLEEARDRPMNVRVENMQNATESVLKAIKDVKEHQAPSASGKSTTASKTNSRRTKSEKSSSSSHYESTANASAESDGTQTQRESAKPSESEEREPPTADASTSGDRSARREEALNYASKFYKRLGADAEGRVYKRMFGEYRAVKDSNLQQLIKYHFSENRDEHMKPPGYQTFMTAVKNDDYLSQRMLGKRSPAKKRSGTESEKSGKSGKGRLKEKSSRFVKFSFKPLIW
jgi:hypothetical protein